MKKVKFTMKEFLPVVLGASVAIVLSACTMYDTFDAELLPSATAKVDAGDGSQSSSSNADDGSQSSSSTTMLESFEDPRDKQVYKIAAIGTHQWFARNLNYDAGDGLSYCYDKNSANCEKYGRLYKGNSSSFVEYLCPKGTHVSTQEDWETLLKMFKGASTDSVAVFLKATNGWDDYEGDQYNANDESGLSMLPGGSWNNGDGFKSSGKFGDWWTSTMPNPDYPYEYAMYQLSYASDGVQKFNLNFEQNALSVRCVVDE